MKPVVLALCSVLLAPYQCATAEYKPPEDTAPKSLWILAERFEKEGQSSARETTLKQLVEQYPGSRYAHRARALLGMPDPLDDQLVMPTDDEPEDAGEPLSAESVAPDAGH
ncbi:MAG: hypothetical protein QM778_20905 [Myxococcales bacterium]